MYVNLVEPDVRLAVFQLKLHKGGNISKACQKLMFRNEEKTVKLVWDPEEASRNGPDQESSTWNGKLYFC